MSSNVVYRWHGWQRIAILPVGFDAEAYGDILTTIERQGFFDCMGSDLIPAEYDNGAFQLLLPNGHVLNSRFSAPRAPRRRRVEALQNEYEERERQRQIERERIADEQWNRTSVDP